MKQFLKILLKVSTFDLGVSSYKTVLVNEKMNVMFEQAKIFTSVVCGCNNLVFIA